MCMKNSFYVRILVVFLALVGFGWSASAQDDAFNRGDFVINAGVGLGTYISYSGYSNSLLPITASAEYGILDLFDGKAGVGVGGYLAYTSFSHKVTDKWNVGNMIVGARVIFHYQFVEKLDTYAGVMAGYNIVSYSHSDNLAGSTFYPTTFAGARYYLAQNIGVFSEVGYGVSPLQVGLTIKF